MASAASIQLFSFFSLAMSIINQNVVDALNAYLQNKEKFDKKFTSLTKKIFRVFCPVFVPIVALFILKYLDFLI